MVLTFCAYLCKNVSSITNSIKRNIVLWMLHYVSPLYSVVFIICGHFALVYSNENT